MRNLQKMREAIEKSLREALDDEVGSRFADYEDKDEDGEIVADEIEHRWREGVCVVFEEGDFTDSEKPFVQRRAVFGIQVVLLDVQHDIESGLAEN